MKFLKDLHVLVLGLGDSGLAMARWCARCGAQVTVWDSREQPPGLTALQNELPGAPVLTGALGIERLRGMQLVLKSPGLAPDDARVAPLLNEARDTGIAVLGELDLFVRALADLKLPSAEAQVPVQDEAVAADTDTDTDTDNDAAMVEAPAPSVQTDVTQAAQEAADIETPAEDTDAADAADAAADTAEIAADAPAAPLVSEDRPLPIPLPPVVEVLPGYRPQILAITGTNGKTTTTAMTALLVERAGKTVATAGNIGPTLLDALRTRLDAGDLPQVWVLELSSFQLEGGAVQSQGVRGFEPDAAVVLNVTQDHLDWHGSMARYTAAKARVFGSRGVMVLNRDDARVEAMSPAPLVVKGKARPSDRALLYFGLDAPRRPGDFGLVVENGMAWLVRALPSEEGVKRRKGEAEELHLQRLMPADALRVRGRHNAANALAALALATAIGCTLAPLLHGLRDYTGAAHRMEFVARIGEVEAYDDSKGTNVGATVAALNGLGADKAPAQLLVILGGDGKGQDFAPLSAPLQRFARAVATLGRDAAAIEAVLGAVPHRRHDTLQAAVAWCFGQAEAGDAVLLSPACASLDMFKSYVQRGQVFVQAVHDVADAHGVLE